MSRGRRFDAGECVPAFRVARGQGHADRDRAGRGDPARRQDLLTLYGVQDEDYREALIALARQSRERTWWTDYRDVMRPGNFVGLEAGAVRDAHLGADRPARAAADRGTTCGR